MNKDTANNLKLREHSAIKIKKCCYLAIIEEIKQKSDDLKNITILGYNVALESYDKADQIIEDHFRHLLHHRAKTGKAFLSKIVGVSRQTINNIATKKAVISWGMAKGLQDVLPISACELRPDIFQSSD